MAQLTKTQNKQVAYLMREEVRLSYKSLGDKTEYHVFCKTCKSNYDGSPSEITKRYFAPDSVIGFIMRHKGHFTWIDTIKG